MSVEGRGVRCMHSDYGKVRYFLTPQNPVNPNCAANCEWSLPGEQA